MTYLLLCIALFIIGKSITCCFMRKRKEKYLDLKDPELNEIADRMRCGTPVHLDEALRVLDAIGHAKKN